MVGLYMKKLIKLFLGVVARVLQYAVYLVPKNDNLIIFGSWKGKKFTDNSKALFLYATKHTNFRCVWICKDKKLQKDIMAQGFECYLSNSLKGIYNQARASAAFSTVGITDFIPELLVGCIHIELWHGVGGGKTIGLDDKAYRNYYYSLKGKIYRFLDYIPQKKHYFLGTSEEMKKVFKSAFKIKDDHFIFAGQPRNDLFYDSAYIPQTYDENLFSFKKVILYLPTHRKEGKEKIECSKIFDLKALNMVCEQYDCLFVIKKHFYHSSELESLEKYDRIIDITADFTIDTNELLKRANYLISDYSSVTADYLLLDRPILYYCYDLQHYLNEDRDVYWDYDSITPGPKAHNFDELRKSLVEVLSGKDDYKLERKRVRDMFYDPSCQCEAANKILSAVENIVSTYR